MDEQTVNSIWKGFGSYIAKQLRNGKGVSVPKFGNFTFSATNVDLAVIIFQILQLVNNLFLNNRVLLIHKKEISS
jgi:hypothetical protein